MPNSSIPDLTAVQRGRERLRVALAAAGEPLDGITTAVLQAVLAQLDTAAMLAATDVGDPHARHTGILTGVLDCYDRELAALGGDR